MEFINKFLDVFVESCEDGIGFLICVFIYLTIFDKARKNWSIRKEVGILILVSLGISIILSVVAALCGNIVSHSK